MFVMKVDSWRIKLMRNEDDTKDFMFGVFVYCQFGLVMVGCATIGDRFVCLRESNQSFKVEKRGSVEVYQGFNRVVSQLLSIDA